MQDALGTRFGGFGQQVLYRYFRASEHRRAFQLGICSRNAPDKSRFPDRGRSNGVKATTVPYIAFFRGGSSSFHSQIDTVIAPVIADIGQDR